MPNLLTELESLGQTLAYNLEDKGVTADYTDGLTTLANKILDIPQGGTCIGIVLDSNDITGINNKAMIGFTLFDNYISLPNVEVTVTGSDNSSRTVTTNNDGYGYCIVTGTTGNTVTYTITYQGTVKNCTVNFSAKSLTELIYENVNNNIHINGNSSKISFNDDVITYASVLETESTYILTNAPNWQISFDAKASVSNRLMLDIGYYTYGDGCLRFGRDIYDCMCEIRTDSSSTTKVFDFGTNWFDTNYHTYVVKSVNNNITVSVDGTVYSLGTFDIKPTLGATKWGSGDVQITNVDVTSL